MKAAIKIARDMIEEHRRFTEEGVAWANTISHHYVTILEELVAKFEAVPEDYEIMLIEKNIREEMEAKYTALEHRVEKVEDLTP